MLASEFGRDMMAEGKPGEQVRPGEAAGHHDGAEALWHAPSLHGSVFVLMFGGGIARGWSTERLPTNGRANHRKSGDDRRSARDHYSSLGIPPDTHYEVEKRPFYVTKDGKGKVVPALLA